jgi:hypothetical protein
MLRDLFEAIPGSLLQMYAIVNNKGGSWEWVQLISLLASTLAVGAISSWMSYLADVTVLNREFRGKQKLLKRNKESGRIQHILKEVLDSCAHSFCSFSFCFV